MRLLASATLLLFLSIPGCSSAPEGSGGQTLEAAGKCACGGAGCTCIRGLCGGTRECGCAGTNVDCLCAKKICKSAGVNFCCSGSHADGGKQRCNSTCACTDVKGKCACSVSCGCKWKR